MITLMLESSSSALSVGLGHENRVIATTSFTAWQRQSELMIPEVVKLLKAQHMSFQDISSVVVARGPGSYTGVRIALTIAKVIGFSQKIPVYATSSLEILKLRNKPTICLINARSGRSYVGVYQGCETLLADTVMTNDEVRSYMATHSEYAVSGDCAYLEIPSEAANVFVNMMGLVSKENLIADIHALRPCYLKEQL